MKETAVVAEEIPAIGISYTGHVARDRQLAMQTHLPQSASAEALNAMLDKIKLAFDRQVAFAEIRRLEAEIKAQEKIGAQQADMINSVDQRIKSEWDRTGKRGDPQLSSKDKRDQEQAYLNGKEIQRRIEILRADLAKQQALV